MVAAACGTAVLVALAGLLLWDYLEDIGIWLTGTGAGRESGSATARNVGTGDSWRYWSPTRCVAQHGGIETSEGSLA